MTTTLAIRHAATLLAACVLAASGCVSGQVEVGSDDEPLIAPPSGQATDACAAYCGVATAKGCPQTGDCDRICARLQSVTPNCTKELDDVLACAAPQLDARCGFTGSGGDVTSADATPCWGVMDRFDACRWRDVGSPMRRIGAESSEQFGGHPGGLVYSRAPSPVGFLESLCDLDDGFCQCTRDGLVFGECQNLISDWDFFAPTEGCCGYALLTVSFP
jgi:hypothetical protein